MPRVLFVHHRPQASGAARSLALLIGALGPEWDAHVIVPDGAAAELFERSGATVHRGPVPAFAHTWDVQYHGLRWLVAVREALWIPGHVRHLRRTLHRLRPDIVHVNDVVMLVSGVVAVRSGVPVVWHLRSSLPNGGRDRRSRWIGRVIGRHASAVIAIDEDVASTYSIANIEVIHNPVEVGRSPAAQLPVPSGRVTVGFFGYLRRQKGWPQLVDAVALLARREAPVHIVVVGGSVRTRDMLNGIRGAFFRAAGVTDEEAEMRLSVRNAGVGDRFTFMPFTDDPGPLYEALDIVVFPNRGVGLGRPVLEAAAYGKPAVAAGSPAGGGVLVPNQTGILLPDASPSAIANALERLARDKEQRARLGEAAAVLAMSWAPPLTAAAVLAVYGRLFATRPPGDPSDAAPRSDRPTPDSDASIRSSA